ncbi:hypothetical protein DB88DRAFT_499170 [Papiliotrema laurentii]|uniref:Uncharacterized protein n=1 Tax=Papiliotrema laurentii TaxID=5418 RepID=A0AAD9CW08_PAPLA|nr:hypothetical protein DB88DRAFT_499170 [Papiliotrema laurentii]
MPALDPFSASSRPMIPFDSLPSKPLPFAATLQPIDQNADASKLPKPKRRPEQFPQKYPLPAYAHSRHSSFDVRELGFVLDQPAADVVGSDEWMKKRVNECVDSAKGELHIKELGLTTLSTEIAGLQNLVTLPPSFSPRAPPRATPRIASAVPPTSPLLDLPPMSPGLLAASSRSFSRISSAPASSAFFNSTQEAGQGSQGDRRLNNLDGRLEPPAEVRRVMPRSRTNAPAGATSLAIYAANNFLTSLPTALFEISNLTLLSLRGNHLQALPAAIGELRNLTDLNISNNRITVIPSTILNLDRLQHFVATSNPFLPNSSQTTASGRLLGPLERRATVPRLYNLCLNILISPRAPSFLPPLLDGYTWEAPAKGSKHALHDADALHELIPAIPTGDLRKVLQALKSCAQAQSRQGDKRRGMASLGVVGRVEPFPTSPVPFPPDDAAENPYYQPCPSPRHAEWETGTTRRSRPGRHLFIHALEERLEWRRVAGEEVPIRWRGCSPGCLSFLEEDEWGEWGVEDE